MSVGFVGSSYQSVTDINGSGARLDVSLQSVLNKYDSIATDLDRLANSATFNVYDTTSKQKYGAYNSDAQSGWAESWYSEYRAVLQMRADALKKRLSASYNRVLEKSVFTEIKPDNTSVFAPYANRTFSKTQTDFQMPASEVFFKDLNATDAVSTVTAPALPPAPNIIFTNLFDYLKAPSFEINTTATANPPNPNAPKTTVTKAFVSGSVGSITAPAGLMQNNGTTPVYSNFTPIADTQAQALYNTIQDLFILNGLPNTASTGWAFTDPADKAKAQQISNSVLSALYANNTSMPLTGTIPLITISTMDSLLAYSNADSIKPLLASSKVALPTATSITVSGWSPSAFYLGVDQTPPLPTPINNLYLTNSITNQTPPSLFADSTLGTPIVAGTPIKTADISYTQNQNATLTGTGYLCDVNLGSALMTLQGKTAAGTFSTSGSGSIFTLNSPTGNIYDAKLIPPVTLPFPTPTTPAEIYANQIAVGPKFIDYGAGTSPITPPTTVIYLDDLDMHLYDPDLATHLKKLIDAGTLKDENGTIVTQLPPPKGELIFKTKFPNATTATNGGDSSWYIGEPRLGLQAAGTSVSYADATPTQATGLVNNYIDRGGVTAPYKWHSEPNGLYTRLMASNPGLNDPVNLGNTPVSTTPSGLPTTTSVIYDSVANGGSYEKAIGNANYTNPQNYSNLREKVPQYGTGMNSKEFDEVFKQLPANVKDTMINDPTVMADFMTALDGLKNSFVGRQYDDTVQGNLYEGQFFCDDTTPIGGLMINGIGFSGLELTYHGGNILPGGIEDIPNAAGVSLLYAGSASALISPTIIGQAHPTGGFGVHGLIGVGPDINYGHLSAVNEAITPALSGLGYINSIPTIGLASGAVEGWGSFTIYGITFTIFLGVRHQKTYDIVTDFVTQVLSAIKPLVVEAIQTQAYAASSGTAFDTYASRGEYHFNGPGFVEALGKLNVKLLNGLVEIPIGDAITAFFKSGSGVGGAITDVISLLGGGGMSGWADPAYATDVNGVSAGTRILEYQHTMQASENRETEAGGFFATQSFLSQFSLQKMESEYWIGTQQNEEVVNNDILRALSVSGTQLVDLMLNALGSASGADTKVTMAIEAIKAVFNDPVQRATMWQNLLYKDLNIKGSGLGGTESHLNGEGFDYVEPDHKPFEGDSDFNYPEPAQLDILGFLKEALGASADIPVPDFVTDGYSNTMRFRKATASTNNSTNTVENLSDNTATVANSNGAYSNDYGFGPQAHAGRETGNSMGGGVGLWADTDLGTINEVYVGKRKVVFNNLDQGLGTFNATDLTLAANKIANVSTGTNNASTIDLDDTLSSATRETYALADRYIGADTRVYGKRYDAADPINFESFNTGMYSTGTDPVTGIGAKYKYDRRNDYSLSFKTAASNNVVNLQGSQALNPSIGGFIKLAEIDKNKTDEALLQYESVDQSTLIKTGSVSDNVLNLQGKTRGSNEQKFGGSAEGKLNEFNKILYESMHLRADGKNLSEFNEYRDVFNMGFMKNFFVSGQSYHPSGGGVTSSLEIRFDTTSGTGDVQSGVSAGVTGTREDYNHDKDGNLINFDPYNTLTLNKSRGKASVYLNNYFAYKKRANKK